MGLHKSLFLVVLFALCALAAKYVRTLLLRSCQFTIILSKFSFLFSAISSEKDDAQVESVDNSIQVFF